MRFTAKDLTGMGLAASDGVIGSIDDVYFDESTWDVRYLVVDTGKWLPGRRVLLIPKVVGPVKRGAMNVPVELSKAEIRDSPPLEVAEPVSRVAETALHGHYGWMPYWNDDPIAPPPPPPARAVAIEEKLEGRRVSLHSFKEVKGYHVDASDGSIGHVDDFVIGADWKVEAIVLDTSNWVGGKCVAVPRAWVSRISWPDAKVIFSVPKQQIADASQKESGSV